MIKKICNPFISIGFLLLYSLTCFGSNLIEGPSPFLKRARSHSSEESDSFSYKDPSPKKRRIEKAQTAYKQPNLLLLPQKNSFILRIAHYARIADSFALISTCRAFATFLQDDRLWKEYVHRIPGHHAFIGQNTKKNGDGFYKNLFQKLLLPYFCPMPFYSKEAHNDIYALSHTGLIFWGALRNTNSEEESTEDKSNSDYISLSEGVDEQESTGSYSQGSLASEKNEEALEQATFWQEGVLNFVPTQQEHYGSCVLDASKEDKVLVGLFYPEPSSLTSKAASWSLNESGEYQMTALPEEKAHTSMAKAVNKTGQKIVGSIESPSPRAVVWEDNKLSFLDVPDDTNSSFATSIDASGDRIVGYFVNEHKQNSPALWINKRLVQLPLPPESKNGIASVINAKGTKIAGYIEAIDPKDNIVKLAVVWTAQHSATLPPQLITENNIIEYRVLPRFSNDSYQNFPQSMDAYGKRIVGYEVFYPPEDSPNSTDNDDGIQRAVLWFLIDKDETYVCLLQHLLSFFIPQGYLLKETTCIDSTGTIIGGNGDPSAWWTYIPHLEVLLDEGISSKALDYCRERANTLKNNNNFN